MVEKITKQKRNNSSESLEYYEMDSEIEWTTPPPKVEQKIKWCESCHRFHDAWYIDPEIEHLLKERIKKNHQQKKITYYLIDGELGIGKSTLACQLIQHIMRLEYEMGYTDRMEQFDVKKNFCWQLESFFLRLATGKRYEKICLDEGSQLESRTNKREMAVEIRELMYRVRHRNYYVFLIIPDTFYILSKNMVGICDGLFHVHEYRGRQGYYYFYFKDRINYMIGNQTMKLKRWYPKFSDCIHGRFTSHWFGNYEEYDQLKQLEYKIIAERIGQCPNCYRFNVVPVQFEQFKCQRCGFEGDKSMFKIKPPDEHILAGGGVKIEKQITSMPEHNRADTTIN